MKKNLYGTRQETANWFDMLKTGLEDECFKQNKVNPCLFVRKNVLWSATLMIVVYSPKTKRQLMHYWKSIKDIQDDQWGDY